MKYKQAKESFARYQERIVEQREFLYNFFRKAKKENLFRYIYKIHPGDMRFPEEFLFLYFESKNLEIVRHKLRKMYGSWNDRVTYISSLNKNNTASVFYMNAENTIELHVDFPKEEIEKIQDGKCKFEEITKKETVLVCNRERK